MSDPTPPTPTPDPDAPTPHYYMVLEAADLVRTTTGTEPITEPLGLSKGMTRIITYDMSSVSVGWKILASNTYREKPSSKAWGALNGTTYTEEEL